MTKLKRLLHLLAFIVCGFFVYCAVMGVACMAFAILTHLAWYHIVFGTALGCGTLVFYALVTSK